MTVPMNQAQEHFIFSNEAAFGTFVAPAKAIPIITCDIASKRGLVIPDLTGYGRSRNVAFQGEKPVAGKLECLALPGYVGSLFKALMTAVTSTKVGATNAYRHKFLFDDTAPCGSLSLEKQYSTSEAQFAKGVKIARLVISCKSKEPARLSFDLVGQDECWAGGTWEDASAAPAAPTTPIPYPASLQLPFRFDIGQLLYGGSLALTAGEIVVTGGAALAFVEAAEITIEIPQEPVYVINNTPCLGYLRDQGRRITIKADLDWIGADDDFVDYHRAGTEGVLQLKFVGAVIETTYHYELVCTLPRVKPAEATPPAIQGAKTRRTQSVLYEALYEPTTTSKDFGLALQNAETTV
jgi:hypothetical protein